MENGFIFDVIILEERRGDFFVFRSFWGIYEVRCYFFFILFFREGSEEEIVVREKYKMEFIFKVRSVGEVCFLGKCDGDGKS